MLRALSLSLGLSSRLTRWPTLVSSHATAAQSMMNFEREKARRSQDDSTCNAAASSAPARRQRFESFGKSRRSSQKKNRRQSLVRSMRVPGTNAWESEVDPSHAWETALEIWERLCALYSLPAVKFVTRLVFRLLFLVLYALFVSDFSTPAEGHSAGCSEASSSAFANDAAVLLQAAAPSRQLRSSGPTANGNGNELAAQAHADCIGSLPSHQIITRLEVVWLVFELGILLDQVHQSITAGYPPRLQWKVGYTLFGAAVVFRTVVFFFRDDEAGTAHNAYQAFQISVSLNAILHVLELQPYLNRLHRNFGVLSITLEEMMDDVSSCVLLRFSRAVLTAHRQCVVSSLACGGGCNV